MVGQVERAIAGDCQVCGLQARGGFSGGCHDVVAFGAIWGWVKGEKHIQLAASFFLWLGYLGAFCLRPRKVGSRLACV